MRYVLVYTPSTGRAMAYEKSRISRINKKKKIEDFDSPDMCIVQSNRCEKGKNKDIDHFYEDFFFIPSKIEECFFVILLLLCYTSVLFCFNYTEVFHSNLFHAYWLSVRVRGYANVGLYEKIKFIIYMSTLSLPKLELNVGL